MIIPTEARASLAAIREGRTLKQYLDDIWSRRQSAQPIGKKIRSKWPFVLAADASQKDGNVHQLGSRAAGNR